MARVLITGGSGFIGTSLVARHLERGDEVLSLDLLDARNPEHEALHRMVDILDRTALFDAFREFRPEIVHHLAARTDIDGATVEEYAANTTGVRHVLEACHEAGVGRVVVASSQLVNPLTKTPKDEVDFDPPNAYGASKVETERITREVGQGLDWVMVRPTSIWGPWFGVKYQGLFRQVRAGRFLMPKGRRIQKVWGYVGNAAWSLSRLGELPSDLVGGKLYYLADFEPYDLGEYAEMIRAAWDAPAIRQVPLPVLQGIAKFGDVMLKAGRSFPLHSYRLGNFLAEMKVSIQPLAQVCGPAPHTVPDGVKATVQWMKDHPDFSRDDSLH